MNFRIKDSGVKDELLFGLKKNSDGGIELVVTDSDGGDWSVLKILSNGKLYLYQGIAKDIGLTVDSDGEIELTEDDD